MTDIKTKKNEQSALTLLLLIIGGIALNILGNKLNGLLGLPLYLDCCGTVAAALMGGYLPCITVGFMSNIINGFSNADTIYYCIISVFIAVAAEYYVKKRMMTRFPHILLPIGVMAFLGGVVGGMLTWLIYGMSFGEGYAPDMAAAIDSAVPMGYILSNLLAAFIIDIIDKAIVVAAAVGIYAVIPKKFKDYMGLRSWSHVDSSEKKDKRGRFSLRTKVAALVSVSITLVAFSAASISVIQFDNAIRQDFTSKGENSVAILADMLTEETVDDLLKNGRDAEDYEYMVDVLNKILSTSPEIKFVYAYKVTEEGSLVVFDMDVPGVEGNLSGEIIEHDATVEKYLDKFLAGEEIPPDVTVDEYGWLLSVYRPVRDSNGEVICYAISDMFMDRLRSEEIAYIAKIISLFVGFWFLIRAYALWMSEKYFVRPINKISDAVLKFSYDTPHVREESVKMVRDLNIRTGDELEDLYVAYLKTIGDMVSYIDEVQHKSNQLANMQNGLILVLADMVENRDQNTGDHVKKTAAYVAIILEQMKSEGVYADKLTDAYIYDVVHSAPLHDVGKIKISDTILNKPGKLTDDEFAKMKTHTTCGREIIDMVIDTVAEESDYLNEARDLAAYHHEKWNGTGYPEGLAGEEIPLSARVMAVADVFDALVSRRSYKEPFTIEKALDISREGSGSHFDPQVVKAFLDAEDEVRYVANLNMEHYDYKQHNL